jgi:hypothetical protein
LNNGINTNKNPIALNGTVTLGNEINLSTGGGDIKIIGAIDGNHLLNLDAAYGNVQVQGNIGGTTPLSVLNVTATQAQFTVILRAIQVLILQRRAPCWGGMLLLIRAISILTVFSG